MAWLPVESEHGAAPVSVRRRGGAASGWSWPVQLALVALLGAVQTLAFTHTRLAWWLPLAAAGVLAWQAAGSADRRQPLHAAALGWTFGTAWLCAGTWWLFISLHRYGGLPAWMAVAAVFALSALLSLYLAAATATFARLRRGRPLADALLFAALWLLAELARGIVFTGFPWLASGYAQLDSPLAGLAPWVGVYGIGCIGAALAAWLALALRAARGSRRWADMLPALSTTAALLVVGTGLAPHVFTQPAGELSVTLLQGNVPQEEKFESEHQGAALDWHLHELLAADTDLVVAPETALPFLPQQMPDGFWASLRSRVAAGRTHALFGVPLGDDVAGYTNSAVGLAPAADVVGTPAVPPPDYRYDKHHLVPFGEFIPLGFKWFTQLMNIPLGDFNRGPLSAPSFAVGGQRVAPNICYEDLFGEDLAARFVGPAGTAPTVFANLSNIGWFGDSVAIDQHLQISRMRALEFQLPMLRATNTGATAVIDHTGRVTASLPRTSRGVLRASVQTRLGVTPFAAWAGRFGIWPLVALAAFTIAAVAGIPAAAHRGADGSAGGADRSATRRATDRH